MFVINLRVISPFVRYKLLLFFSQIFIPYVEIKNANGRRQECEGIP